MNQHQGEILGNLIPLGVFIYLALVINGVVKTRKEIPLLTNPSTIIKVVIYTGIFIFLALVIIGIMGK